MVSSTRGEPQFSQYAKRSVRRVLEKVVADPQLGVVADPEEARRRGIQAARACLAPAPKEERREISRLDVPDEISSVPNGAWGQTVPRNPSEPSGP